MYMIAPNDNDSQTTQTRHHLITLKSGIRRSPEFARKGLAEYAVNVGLKCSHDCRYCSSGSLLRTHPAFKENNESPFEFGYSLIDPEIPDHVADDARRIPLKRRGTIQLCTTVDAWAPEGQKYDIGRRCLEAILGQPGWKVRILTKNAAIAKDFDLIEQHADRVILGLSLTGTPARSNQVAAVEPNASRIEDRIATLQMAHKRGIRTYAMLCPLLPGVASGESEVEELVKISLAHGAEQFFVEPVNARGRGLILTAEALRSTGHLSEARAVDEVRKHATWSTYSRNLLLTVQNVLRRHDALNRLRYLAYPSFLTPADRDEMEANSAGVVWLGKD